MQKPSQGERKTNKLIDEKSPYLLQHAYNPVDWYPWSQEALNRAKAEDKPIFLSIGYFACHWCHVMEKESFQDEDVSRLLNNAFVCIKVDREERPDLDSIYMAVCQAMGRNCGWPLNIMMTPRMNPFFAASYIPKHSRNGLTGMTELIPQVMHIWKLRKTELEILGADIRSRIEALEKRIPEKEPGKELLQDAYYRLSKDFDVENGGFGRAPKFPRPHSLMFLLRYWKRTGTKHALDIVEKTLSHMRRGGIFDQIGFGFHRYSTDAQWLVPHFEKMLYDQALLALAFTEAFQATGSPMYGLAAKEIIEYAIRDLSSPQGGFFSAQDADTEGEEGKFYLWTMDEVLNVLSPADADLATLVFGIKSEGNFQGGFRRQNGKNILHFDETLEEIAARKGVSIQELINRVNEIRIALFEARKKRSPPATDDKILTDWNGLMVAALAKVGSVLNEPKYIEAAIKATDFLLNQMHKEGVLYHRYAKGEKAVEGFLDDYAFFVFGLIELYEATFQEKFVQTASELTKSAISRFWDQRNGGFFLTSENIEVSLPRIKQVYDGAIPSGNSVILHNLLRLSSLTQDRTYLEKGSKLLKVFSNEVQAAPEAYSWLLGGIDLAIGPSHRVLLVGESSGKDTIEILEALRKKYIPNMLYLVKNSEEAGLGYDKIDDKTTAYICRDQMCLPPTNQIKKMMEHLED